MGRSRRVGIGMDYSATSKKGLRWAIENMIGEGDEIIIIHVASPKSEPTNKLLFQDTGSRTYYFLSFSVVYMFFFLINLHVLEINILYILVGI